jgi:hypothetical protein
MTKDSFITLLLIAGIIILISIGNLDINPLNHSDISRNKNKEIKSFQTPDRQQEKTIHKILEEIESPKYSAIQNNNGDAFEASKVYIIILEIKNLLLRNEDYGEKIKLLSNLKLSNEEEIFLKKAIQYHEKYITSSNEINQRIFPTAKFKSLEKFIKIEKTTPTNLEKESLITEILGYKLPNNHKTSRIYKFLRAFSINVIT